jgi:ribosome recycling factor
MNDDFEKVVDAFKKELTSVRTGRASPALIESLQVNVASYGAQMPLNQLSSISAPDARLLVVNPWDKGTLNDIEKAIKASGLGFNPSNDGQLIRVPIPALTSERRKEMVRLVGRMTEESRVRARAVRRDYNELFKSLEADKDITQDDLKRYLDQVQKTTDEIIKKVEDLALIKEKEVLEA